jgi:hypothetical protein
MARFRRRLAAILLAVVLAGAAAAFAAHGSAEAAIQGGVWPAGVIHPAAASCPTGETLVEPTSGWTDDLGVSRLTYKSAPGMVTILAPRGLKASTVTPALLADLGVSTRSRSGVAVRQAVVRQALSESARPVAPAFCESRPQFDLASFHHKTDGISGPGRKNGQVFGHVYGAWGGTGITEAESGVGISAVSGNFTVGKDQTTLGPGAEATWLGIGGGLAHEGPPYGLIQDGVSMQSGEGYQSWFQTVNYNSSGNYTCCNAQYTTTPGNVSPGDSIAAEVWWSSTTEACFYLYDAQHNAADIPITCISTASGEHHATTYDHTSAEWVNEEIIGSPVEKDPQSKDMYYYYDNPGTIKWTGQEFSSAFGNDGSWQSPFPGAESIIMAPNGSTGTSCGSDNGVLSYPDDFGTNADGGYSSIQTCVVPETDSP